MIDLHTHTTTSDGTDTPEELVRKAVATGIRFLAVSDHDTIEGVQAAINEATRINHETGHLITVIPAVEFSTRHNTTRPDPDDPGATITKHHDVHILGYDIPLNDPDFLDAIDQQTFLRMRRDLKMIAKMNDDGIPVTMEELTGGRLNTIITRANYGQWLYEHGYATSVNDAFDRLIGRGCPYYVSRKHIPPVQAVEIIKAADGLPFFAHPGLTKMTFEELDQLVAELVEAGLVGIEVYHSDHTPEQMEMALDLAKKYDLEISRGTDYHGIVKPNIRLGHGRDNLPDIPLPPSVAKRLESERYFAQG